jgi:hypothetical protein
MGNGKRRAYNTIKFNDALKQAHAGYFVGRLPQPNRQSLWDSNPLPPRVCLIKSKQKTLRDRGCGSPTLVEALPSRRLSLELDKSVVAHSSLAPNTVLLRPIVHGV